jgi:hypothetical protein
MNQHLSDAERSGELFVNDVGGWLAQLVVLQEQGHVPNFTFGDDDETQRFVQDVRKLNRDWVLGRRAIVPTRVNAAMCSSIAPRSRPRTERRPRDRSDRTALPSRGPPGEDGDSDPHPFRRCEVCGAYLSRYCPLCLGSPDLDVNVESLARGVAAVDRATWRRAS